jgi:hypothetical protein
LLEGEGLAAAAAAVGEGEGEEEDEEGEGLGEGDTDWPSGMIAARDGAPMAAASSGVRPSITAAGDAAGEGLLSMVMSADVD